MKRKLLTAAFFIGAWGAYSQVGIGTLDPSKSSQLDVSSTNKGILIPRVQLVSATDNVTIQNGNVNSLLVFNTNTSDGMEEAYYYWHESKWLKVLNENDISSVDTNTKNQSFRVENNQLILTDSDNNFITLDISELNIITTLTNNNNGTYSYISENGTNTLIDVPSDVINQFAEIADDQNVKQIIEQISRNVSGNVYYDGNSFTYIDSNGAEQNIDINALVKANETVTKLVLNADGTYTYTNEKNETVVIDPFMVSVTLEDGIYKFTDHNGNELTQINTNADHIGYDNSRSGLTALNVQDALDELVEKINNVSIIGKNLTAGDGSIEVTDGTGATLVNSNIRVAAGGITSDKLADDAVTNDKIADGAVTNDKLSGDPADAGKVPVVQPDGTVVYENISSDNVDGKDLTAGDGSIEVVDGTGATLVNSNIKVAAGGITSDKLAEDAVTNDKLADGAVTSDKMGADGADAGKVPVAQPDGTVVYENIASDNVDGKDLTAGDGSIEVVDGTGATLVNSNIKVAAGGITSDKLADDAVTNDKIADGAVTSDKMGADGADAGKVPVAQPDGTVVYENVSSENVDGKDLTAGDGSIEVVDGTGATLVNSNIKVAAGGITSDKLADGAVTNDKLSGDPVDAGKVPVVQPDGTVVYENVSSENVDGKDLTAGDGSIEVVDGTGATLVNSNIKVAAGGITSDKLADGSVTTVKMDSETAAIGHVATADGNGGVTFEPLPANENSWKIVGTTDSATDEASDIYHSGITYIGAQVSGNPPVTEDDVKLHVTGNIETTGKVFTTNSVYADYVFEKYFIGKSLLNDEYEFKSLEYIKDYTMQYHHLPGVTSIDDLKKNKKGYQFDLTQLTIQQLEKIEELFLHLFELEEQFKLKEKELEALKTATKITEDRLLKLEKQLSDKN